MILRAQYHNSRGLVYQLYTTIINRPTSQIIRQLLMHNGSVFVDWPSYDLKLQKRILGKRCGSCKIVTDQGLTLGELAQLQIIVTIVPHFPPLLNIFVLYYSISSRIPYDSSQYIICRRKYSFGEVK